MQVCGVNIDVSEVIDIFFESMCLVDILVVLGTSVDERCLMC